MRQRVLLGLTWLVATAVATAVGLATTQTVGDVLRGTGPLGPAFDSTSPIPTETARTVQQTVTDPAATLVVDCTGRTAVLRQVVPARGWRVLEQEVGPDEDVDVRLGAPGRTRSVEVYCNEGTPRAVVT